MGGRGEEGGDGRPLFWQRRAMTPHSKLTLFFPNRRLIAAAVSASTVAICERSLWQPGLTTDDVTDARIDDGGDDGGETGDTQTACPKRAAVASA